MAPTIHASAVLIGARAVLIQGPSGSGKSRLALAMIEAADTGALPFARLVGDDRVHVTASHGRLLVRPADAIAGRIEVRGVGIRTMEYERAAVVGLVVDLGADGERMPSAQTMETVVEGIRLPRLAVAAGANPLNVLLAHTGTLPAGPEAPEKAAIDPI
jgi:HPr kinase/phosphorylase